MRKFIYSSVCFWVCSILAMAQADLRWSDYIKSADQGGEILGKASGRLYSVMVEDRIPYLVMYDSDDLLPGSFYELMLGNKAKPGAKVKAFTWDQVRKRRESDKSQAFLFEKAFLQKDKIVLVYYTYERPLKTFYAQTFDLEGTPLQAPVELDRFEEKRTSAMHHFGLSQDSSSLYLFRQPRLKGEEMDRCIVKVWNENLQSIHSKSFEMPYRNRDFMVYDYYLTSDYHLVTLVRIYVPREERDAGGPAYQFKVLSFDLKAEGFVDVEMKLSTMFIRDVNLRFDEHENAYCVGTYSDDRRLGNLRGTFYYKLDYRNGSISAELKEDFSKDLVYQLNNSESKRRRNQELRANIELKAVHAKADGGSFVLFEEQYVEAYTTRGPNGVFTTTYYYNNNDILILNLDSLGEVIWQAVVPKQQVSTNDNGFYNSFFSMVYNGNLFIVTNDHIKNIQEGNFETQIGPQFIRRTLPVVIKVTPEGNYEKTALMVYDRKRDFRITFKDAVRISENQAIVYGYKNSRGFFQGGKSSYKVGRIAFDLH